MNSKKITAWAQVSIITWNAGMFFLIYYNYYNDLVFDTYKALGAFFTFLIYLFMYGFICQAYSAFRLVSSSIGEALFAQIISFGIADVIIFIECCLIYNKAVAILPEIYMLMLQAVGTAALILLFKNLLIRRVKPQLTLLVYGQDMLEEEVVRFRNGILEKYSHLFLMDKFMCENEEPAIIKKAIEHAETVILFEVERSKRAKMVQLALKNKKNFYLTPTLEDIILEGCSYRSFVDTPLLKFDYRHIRTTGAFVKRMIDIVFSALILIVLLPLLLVVAIAIKLEDGGPVFFIQKRCTLNERVFNILKFRSMIVDAEKHGVAPCVDCDPRITRVGAFIRKTRIDELPQLVNILKGDMSFVGPRPERIEHVQKYEEELPEFFYRHTVKGGLTGNAQVFGKYNTSAYDKLRLDMTYIVDRSILTDLKLVLLTIRTVFTPESTKGFSQEKSDTIREIIKSKEEYAATQESDSPKEIAK